METDVLNLIELLMNQLLKLDGIMADGDVKLQRKMQVMLGDLDALCSFCVIYNISNCIWLCTHGSNGSETLLLKVKRVQKYVETLDLLKVKNSVPSSNGPVQAQQKHSNGQRLGGVQEKQQKHSNGHNRLALAPIQEQQQEQPRNSNENSLALYQEQQHQTSRNSTSEVVVTTNWELFDSAPPLIPVHSTSPPQPPSVTNTSGPPKFNWEFFN